MNPDDPDVFEFRSFRSNREQNIVWYLDIASEMFLTGLYGNLGKASPQDNLLLRRTASYLISDAPDDACSQFDREFRKYCEMTIDHGGIALILHFAYLAFHYAGREGKSLRYLQTLLSEISIHTAAAEPCADFGDLGFESVMEEEKTVDLAQYCRLFFRFVKRNELLYRNSHGISPDHCPGTEGLEEYDPFNGGCSEAGKELCGFYSADILSVASDRYLSEFYISYKAPDPSGQLDFSCPDIFKSQTECFQRRCISYQNVAIQPVLRACAFMDAFAYAIRSHQDYNAVIKSVLPDLVQYARQAESESEKAFAFHLTVAYVDIYEDLINDILTSETESDLFSTEKILSQSCALPAAGYCLENADAIAAIVNAISADWKDIRKSSLYNMYPALESDLLYLAYCSGSRNTACDFILANYGSILQDDYSNQKPMLILAKCILESDDYIQANTLHGIFTEEINRCNLLRREKLALLKHCRELYGKICAVEEECHGKYQRTFNFDDMIDYLENGIVTREISENYYHKLEVFTFFLYQFEDENNELNLQISNSDLNDTAAAILRGGTFDFESIYYYYKYLEADCRLQEHVSELYIDKVNSLLGEIRRIKNQGSENADALLESLENTSNNIFRFMKNDRYVINRSENIVMQEEQNFLKRFSLDDKIDLIGKLDQEEAVHLKNFLATSNVVYQFLKDLASKSVIDYSPAIISMTKSLEIIMNHVMRKSVPPVLGDDQQLVYKYFNDSRSNAVKIADGFYGIGKKCSMDICKEAVRKKSVPLGTCNLLLCLEFDHSSHSTLFEHWKVKETLDISRLTAYSGIPLFLEKKSSAKSAGKTADDRYVDHFETADSRNADSHNLKKLSLALKYITDNYRNVVAHETATRETDYVECKKLLISEQYMLWILLDLLKK